jgi:hypothetical protein
MAPLGLDWVLLAERNIQDKQLFGKFVAAPEALFKSDHETKCRGCARYDYKIQSTWVRLFCRGFTTSPRGDEAGIASGGLRVNRAFSACGLALRKSWGVAPG